MESYQIVLVAGLLALTALVVGFAYRVRGPEDRFCISVLRLLCLAVCRLIHRLEHNPVADPLPPDGPCIVVANHRSAVDPVLVAGVTRRWIRFLMAREYYELPGMRLLFRYLGCIPVNRDGNDLTATRRALEALREGKAIGIFPQGGIRDPDDDLESVKAGVALLALRSKAPVIPLYIDGSPHSDSVLVSILRPSRSRIFCGEPLETSRENGKPSREELARFTAEIREAIARLRDKALSLDATGSRVEDPAALSREPPGKG
ncbi:MAG: lysophospholipid acyltransferase family protein [Planctomycetota bacterium]|nr:lysophospholipid acyltransferase family protein [Planctomycetota bacterium]